ncbi:lipoprotein [Beggiatoa sp. PS]|nr:lipoprotein [Beggiatoa sp. PS]
MLRLLKMALWALLITVMIGCSTTADNRADYKKSTTVPSLELPPDLIGSTRIEEQMVVPDVDQTTTFSDYNQVGAIEKIQQPSGINVLPNYEKIQVKRRGKNRWLLIQEEPNILWSKIKQFWQDEGFQLKIERPKIGLMETNWAENRADLPQQGLRKLLGKVFDTLHSASTRDKFRIRFERGTVENITEIYLTHRGLEEVSQGQDFVWQNRPSDPELEAEMLNRLMVSLGLERKQAETLIATPTPPDKDEDESSPSPPVSRAQLTKTKEGQINLVINEDFARAWRRTGLALDRVGFTVEDRDRSRGLYFIRYIDPDVNKEKGFFEGWFSNDSSQNNQEYRLSLIEELPVTRLVVLNSQEQIDTTQTAEKILLVLHEQLK